MGFGVPQCLDREQDIGGGQLGHARARANRGLQGIEQVSDYCLIIAATFGLHGQSIEDAIDLAKPQQRLAGLLRGGADRCDL